jgi:alpha-L-fucosidase 2
MVFGEVQHERWQLNEDSVWYGCATDRNPRHALKYLPKLRKLVEDGLLKEAEKLVEVAFVATPESQRHYEPLGQINLDFIHSKEEISNYERSLDLNHSLAGVSYDVGDVRYSREVFASNPDNVIVGRFSTSKPQKLSFDMRIFRGVDTNVYMSSIEEIGGSLVMKGRTGGDGVHFCLVATVKIEEGSKKPSQY